MTDLKSILKNDINRTIDGVIKADDQSHIRMEVDEYVLTKEVLKHLNKLISGYKESQEEVRRGKTYPFNGVWISGYFGSGKSHLLKMLSYVLESKTIEGTPLSEIFLPKIEDQLFRADFQNVLKVPAQSILFNIDQVAIAAPKESDSALLYIFESVFNDHCGYFSGSRGVAEFEQHLDEQGHYSEFKNDFQRITGKTWEERRKAAFGLARKDLVRVLMESQKMTEVEANNLIDHYKAGSNLTIESFADRVKAWLDSQESTEFRLNFFIDEVGQFIAGKTRLMLNLQTLAETLGTVCQGRVWIFVTSQEDLNSVVGLTDRQQVQDFSKINARYHFKIALNSADVEEVIQKRLLDKTEEGDRSLGELYMKEQETFRTLFRMEEGGRQIKFKSKEQFVLSYPFQAYQYNLLQLSLKTLSEHNAFRGQHISRGERSMLEIFQDVSKQMQNAPLFNWATFDMMFEGIRQTLNTGLIEAVNTAEKQLSDHPMAIKLLKILLMVKYVRTFKATQEHLRILLISDTGQDLNGLNREIGEALNKLEYETYIERNGSEYSYLTNEEKDIEQEIKHVDISYDDVRKILGDMIFTDILKLSTKIRYNDLKEDYTYMRYIDGAPIGKPADLILHFVTPEHPNYSDTTAVINQSMAKKEMTVILPADKTFQTDLRLYYQTDLYCRQQQGHEKTVQVQNIISSKQQQNGDRKNLLRNTLSKMIGEATIYIMGNKQVPGSSEAKTRIEESFQSLIQLGYPKLRYLGNNHYREEDLKKIFYPDDDSALFGGDAVAMDEAEKEMFNTIQIQFSRKEVPTLKSIFDSFSSGSFGWYPMAVAAILAKLHVREKIEFTQGNNSKSRDEVYVLLSGNRDHEQIRIRPLAVVSHEDLEELRNLHMDLFHGPLLGTNGKECSISFKDTLFRKYQDIQGWVNSESENMSFLRAFPLERLNDYIHHDWNWYLDNLKEYKTELADFIREEVEPLAAFMTGSQKDTWKVLKTFVENNRDNLASLEKSAELMELEAFAEQVPYRNNSLRNFKKAADSLKKELEGVLDNKKKEAISYIEKKQEEFVVSESFTRLDPEKQAQVVNPFKELKKQAESQTQLVNIRDIIQTSVPRIIEQSNTEMHKILYPEKKISYANDEEKRIPFKPILITEEDVLEYAETLKERYLELVRLEKRITL